ncbi:hypothetical protein SKAU_G00214750 [Synaphobranchus kaupii]|uniref:Uncharacterized protein n=1 Tax=Synaphobranchus kaupii TaxID=118154 RepID=A0A9Q1FA07_SYNKA|nr:hypothetical protein SKAU_G00214750 [Synaphobranchus kaupii]
MLRVQAPTEDQKVDFVLGALEGTAQREVRLLGGTFFQCRQRPGEPLVDYQLNLCELHSRWQEPSGEAGDDTLLRDQFLLGLDDGPVKQELQRQA